MHISQPPLTTRHAPLLRTLLLCLAVAASLLTFPAAIPAMIAAWLAWHTGARLRRRSGWLPLAICSTVLFIKGTWLWAGVAALLLSLTVALAIEFASRKWGADDGVKQQRLAYISIAALWLGWCCLAFDWHTAAHVSQDAELRPDRPVVLLGDSLMAGVPPHGGLAEHVRARLSVPVIDLSQAGIPTSAALKKLPELKAARPQAVVIELGGHDFLQGKSRDQARANLEQFIRAAIEVGAQPILIEIPRGFITDPYRSVERELAREYDLELIADSPIRELVLWSPNAPPGMWTKGPYLSQDGS